MKHLVRLVSLLLMVCLALPVALADEDRVAELEAELEAERAKTELYYPYYEKNIVVTYEGGVIMLEEVVPILNGYVSQYASYGYDLFDYVDEDIVEQQVLEDYLTSRVIIDKAAELGVFVLDEETEATFRASAESMYASYVEMLKQYYTSDTREESEILAEIDSYLAELGLDVDSIYRSLVENQAIIAVQEYINQDITVSEEDVEALYTERVTEDVATYAGDPSALEQAYMEGATFYWLPEGVKYVKHILFQFSDEQQTTYDTLVSEQEELETEYETAEDDRKAEIDVRLAEITLELDALYAELDEKVDAAMARIDAGEDFDTVMADLGEDPGMQEDPYQSTGYLVCEGGESFVTGFENGAMELDEIGETVVARSSYGVHIMYLVDLGVAGDVAYALVHDDLEAEALEIAQSEAYETFVATWVEEAQPVYYQDRFVY